MPSGCRVGDRSTRGRVSRSSVLLTPGGCSRPRGVGRVVLETDARGPVAIPVNYQLLDGHVVLRTAFDSTLDRAVGNRVGFEVDHLDHAFARGWSVLVTGRLERVAGPEEVARLTRRSAVPWAGGDRPIVLRIDPGRITGRRISSRWSGAEGRRSRWSARVVEVPARR